MSEQIIQDRAPKKADKEPEQIQLEPVEPSSEVDLSKYTNVDSEGYLKKQILSHNLSQQEGVNPKERQKVSIVFKGYSHETGEVLECHPEKDDPYTFRLGDDGVIKGLNKGIETMEVGEIANFIIHQDWAYGKEGFTEDPCIPPNTDMRYEVELLNIDPDTKLTKWDIKAEDRFECAQKTKEEGNKLFKENKIEEALTKYEECIDFLEWEKEEEAVDLKVICLQNAGWMLTKLKQYPKAKGKLNWAVNLRPNNTKAWLRRATCNCEDGMFDEAIRDIKQCVAQEPKNKDINIEYKRIVAKKNAYIHENQGMFSKGLSKAAAEDDLTNERVKTKNSDQTNPFVKIELVLKRDKFLLNRQVVDPADEENFEYENLGEVEVELFENLVPNAVEKFFQMKKKGLLSKLEFCYMIKNNFIETRQPDGKEKNRTISDSVDWSSYPFVNIDNESSALKHQDIGYLYFYSPDSLENSYDMGITLNPIPWYDGTNQVFGHVCKGIDILKKLNGRLLDGKLDNFKTMLNSVMIKSCRYFKNHDHTVFTF